MATLTLPYSFMLQLRITVYSAFILPFNALLPTKSNTLFCMF